MILHWELHVKFRAFGITFGTLDKSGDIQLAFPVPIPPQGWVPVNERGVFLRLELRAAQ